MSRVTAKQRIIDALRAEGYEPRSVEFGPKFSGWSDDSPRQGWGVNGVPVGYDVEMALEWIHDHRELLRHRLGPSRKSLPLPANQPRRRGTPRLR